MEVVQLIVSLPKAKEYLRIDTDAEDDIVRKLLRASEHLCMDVARLDEDEFKACGAIAKTAVLYTVGYLYEHRDDADHKALTLTLRSLLMGIRRGGF
ncbi:MAG: phage gp6-like head-tail connector protein [Selenomonas sp.]|nr:phage gp6-like head-tail connector protein [Selenomonas sp.]